MDEYYRLCKIRVVPMLHFINRVKGQDIYIDKQQELLFNEQEGIIKIKETIIGASEEDNDGIAIVYC